jgi:hypothetical protein
MKTWEYNKDYCIELFRNMTLGDNGTGARNSVVRRMQTFSMCLL